MAQVALVALTAAASLSAHDGATAPIAAAAPVEAVDLQAAIEQGSIKAEFNGNGREALRADILARAKDAAWLARFCQVERAADYPMEDIYIRNPPWRGTTKTPFGFTCR